MLYLRTQTEVLAQVRMLMRDPSGVRWTDAEVYAALNDALLSWRGRVAVVDYTTLDIEPGTNGYTLPAWVSPPFRVQVGNMTSTRLAEQLALGVADPMLWSDVAAYTVESGGDAWSIRWGVQPPSAQARVAYLMDMGPVPTVTPTLSGAITAAVTTFAHTGVLTVGNSGFIRIDQEWMRYGGVTQGATTTTLDTVLRDANNTVAASHASGAAIAYGIPATSPELYNCIVDHVRAVLHEMYLTNASPAEQQKHQQMTSFYRQLVAQFWAKWRDPNGVAFGGRIVPGKIVGVW